MNELDPKQQQDLINSFFDTFGINDTNGNGDSLTYENDLQSLLAKGLAQYQEIEIPPEIEQKIIRLQGIANQFDQREFHQNPFNKGEKEYKIDYKLELNPQQFYAATTLDGPVLVIAGAGSGKTRTIVYRVGFLLENGIEPEEILLLTFTRKAANEMVQRTIELLKDERPSKITGGTFHAFSNHLLRKYANLLKIPPYFTIIDTIDAEDVIDLIRQEMKFDKKQRAFPKKKRIQNIISKSRNCNTSIREVIETEYSGLAEYITELEVIAQAFQQYKKANFLFDYDDLMEFLRDSLKHNRVFRRKVQDKFKYIMVDEFQDTNIVQKEIVDLIAEKTQNIMVVGDDTQSIYAFRGANFENILNFPLTYPQTKIIKLEQNYRSNQDILDFTNQIATQAKLGYKKTLFSENHRPCKPLAKRFYDNIEEAEYIVGQILELREKDVPLEEMAVLYRASFHGNYIQAELLKRNIPYVVVGGIRFTERRHVKDIIAYLRIILNPLDAVAWNRILKLLPGVGRVTASTIVRAIHSNEGKLDVSKFSGKKYTSELALLEKTIHNASKEDMNVFKKIEVLVGYYGPILRNLEDDYELRLQDMDVLLKLASRYESLEKFLSDFALDPPSNQFQDQNNPLIDENEERPVTLSTIHSAKGLEWHAVFVPHLLDGLFPSNRSMGTIEELEEERRLFYVACSRAKEILILTMPEYHQSYDAYFYASQSILS